MDFQDLITLSELQEELERVIEDENEAGIILAQKEADYKIAVNKKALKLRADGIPVTLLSTIIYGYPEIANKRLERDIAESNRNTLKEKINSLKLRIRIKNEQISREWYHNG